MNNKQILKRTLLSSALLTASLQVSAGHTDLLTSDTLLTGHINDIALVKDSGLEVGLWAAASITANSNGGSNQATGNAPVGFNDRVNEVLLNQLNFYIERAVNTEGKQWDIGGRFDFMYGTDARFTQATGWDDNWSNSNYYHIAMPQLYAEVYAPIGNGISAKFGHFYTTIGYEVVTAPDNFFYSHAYTMLYGEPFTHTGTMFSYDLDANWSINGGAVVGWDSATDSQSAWNFLGGASWTSNDGATAVTVQLISGDVSDAQAVNRTMYSVVVSHDFTDKFHYVLQHDYGVQDQLGDWFGINQYFTYDIIDQLAVGLRAEWFNDTGNAKRVNDIGANYLAFSFGVNYNTPMPWLKLRPELRIDWADERIFKNDTGNHQVGFAMDMIVTF